jgi:uncharacterized damage-inducible protein DinB
MSNLTKFNIATLSKVLFLIEPLENIWIIKNKKFNNETIGRHVRHIIDFYLCFINDIDSNFINYDARKRNDKIESDIFFARNQIDKIIHFLKNRDLEDHKVKVKMNWSVSNLNFNSSCFRELMHVADHAIHHANLIQIIIQNEFSNLAQKCDFHSPSTLDAKKCAQ